MLTCGLGLTTVLGSKTSFVHEDFRSVAKVSKPRLLDLFCKAGGGAMGYSRAGLAPYGIDIEPQKNYPFPFLQMDALEAMRLLLRGEGLTFSNGETLYLHDFSAIHASPPCQGYSIMRNLPWLRDKEYPLLIEATRERLIASGVPWVIENVMGAQRKANMQAGFLCGQMFGIPVLRHRLFQTSFFWLQPAHMRHWGTVRNGRKLGSRARDMVTVIPIGAGATPGQRGIHGSHGGNGAQVIGANVGHAAGFAAAKLAMGIDWMKRDELTQAIPPVMTEYIGRWLLEAL